MYAKTMSCEGQCCGISPENKHTHTLKMWLCAAWHHSSAFALFLPTYAHTWAADERQNVAELQQIHNCTNNTT